MNTYNTLCLMTLFLLANTAYATTCPEVSKIEQTPMVGGGFSYTAAGPDGNEWVGGDKWTEKNDLSSYVFTSVRLQKASFDPVTKKSKDSAVICRYEGTGENSRDGEANTVMVLKTGKALLPVEGNWTVDCHAKEPSCCTFN